MDSIKEWLNANIGLDMAAYIPIFLGVIALFWGANKTHKKINQKLTVKENSTGIQAGRDVKINERKK